MFCEICGHVLVDGSHFCAKCGATTEHKSTVSTSEVVIANPTMRGEIPRETQKWNWGAATLTWIWALGNGSYWWALVGFLLNATGIGWIAAFFLFGFNGSEWAWKNKRWMNVGHFSRVQRSWSRWGVGLCGTVIILALIVGFLEEDVNHTNDTSKATSEIQQTDPVTQADYNEGYKAGYVDGRSSNGTLGDTYSEPATEERKNAYLGGYLDGFLKGCREGGFDCSQVESALKEESKSETVQLIPSGVN